MTEHRCENKDALSQILTNQEAALALLKAQSRAFPENRHGEPDYEGHYDHHAGLIKHAEKLDATKHEAIKKVVAAACVGFGGIMVYALWDYAKAHL